MVHEGAIESFRINRVSLLSGSNLRKNVRAFFPQGQSKLSLIMRCPYKAGVRKAGCEYNEDGFLKKFNPLVTKIEVYVLKFMLHGFTELDEKSSQYPRS